MDRDGRAAQVVFGDDRAGAAAFDARQRLELIGPVGRLAEIDGGDVFRRPAEALRVGSARQIDASLRLQYGAGLGIGVHALDHRHQLIGVGGRLHDPLERVAAHAIDQLELLVVGARDAHHPLGIGELPGEIARLAKLQIGGGRLSGGNVCAPGTLKVIPDRPNADGIFARLEPVRREAVAALIIGYDADGDRRPLLLGADDHAFHRPFFGGGDLAGKRRRSLGPDIGCADGLDKQSRKCRRRNAREISREHNRLPVSFLPPRCRPNVPTGCAKPMMAESVVQGQDRSGHTVYCREFNKSVHRAQGINVDSRPPVPFRIMPA